MTTNPARRRIGLLLPSSNTVMEPDFYRNAPLHVTVHTARMRLEDVTVAAEEKMLDEYTLPAARDLATARPDVIVYGCTSAGALRGNAYDRRLCDEIATVTCVPTVSVIRSVRDALSALGARRLAVFTPYTDAINRRVRASLEEDGFEVAALVGLGITSNLEIGAVKPERIVEEVVHGLAGIEADAVFVSCTNFRAMEALPALRTEFHIPIVTSNQAALETALQEI
jgi:maleate isomerase